MKRLRKMPSTIDIESVSSGSETPCPTMSFSSFLSSDHPQELTEDEITQSMASLVLSEDISADPMEDVEFVKGFFESHDTLADVVKALRLGRLTAKEHDKVHVENIICSIFWMTNSSKRDQVRNWVKQNKVYTDKDPGIMSMEYESNWDSFLFYKAHDGISSVYYSIDKGVPEARRNDSTKRLYVRGPWRDGPYRAVKEIRLAPSQYSVENISEPGRGLPEKSIMMRYFDLLDTRKFQVNNEYILYWIRTKDQ